MPKRIAIVVLVVLHAAVASSWPPEISSVSSEVGPGRQIFIQGVGFGPEGPDIVLFDDFDGGSAGEIIPLDGPDIGAWTGTTGHQPAYHDDGTGNPCFWAFQPEIARLFVDFPRSPHAFLSYRVMVPSGHSFPGCETPGELDFHGSVSSWKLAWLLESPGAYTHDAGSDVIVPMQSGPTLRVAGNSGPLTSDPDTGEPGFGPVVGSLASAHGSGRGHWWSWFDWNRYSVALIAPPAGSGPGGTLWAQATSEYYGTSIYRNDHMIIHRESTPETPINPWYTRLVIPGWGTATCTDDPDAVDCEVRVLYDDIYLATGENCRARVEIGNAPVYEDCSVLALATVDAWSDTEIAATVRWGQSADGSVDRDEDLYLFVVTGGGEISSGFPIGPLVVDPGQIVIMGPGAPAPVTTDTAAVDSP